MCKRASFISFAILPRISLQLPSYGSVGASCYQSSDLAPHYGDMRSAATTGNHIDDANLDTDVVVVVVVVVMMKMIMASLYGDVQSDTINFHDL